MTREEAKVILKGFMENPLYSDIPRVCRAFDMAIEALEQEPSEDTEVIKVSKGTVKARQGRYVIYDVEWLKKNFYATEEKIYGQPKQPCDDTISRGAVLDLARKGVLVSNDNFESVCKAINDIPPSGQIELRGKTDAENDGL